MMAEIIQLREIQAARRESRRGFEERQSLLRAIAILKLSLAQAAEELVDAPAHQQGELLGRIERLAALVRYGMRMSGDEPVTVPDRLHRGYDWFHGQHEDPKRDD